MSPRYADFTPARRRQRSLTIGVTAAVAITGLLAASCSVTPGAKSSATVRALWFGKDSKGGLVSGVTPLTITETRSETPSPFSVDLSGMNKAGAGEVWTAAASTASAVATLASGQDPRFLRPSFSLSESIDGPSAGALTTAGVFAAISRAEVKSDVTMTGTILPDGGVGYVGGIPEKIRAAAANGIKEVFIPAGQERSVDPRTKRTLDVIELGQQLGVKVNSARTVWDAYRTLSGVPATAGYAQAEPPAASPETMNVVVTATRAAVQRTRAAIETAAPEATDTTGVSGTQLRTSIAGELARAEDQLAQSQAFAAYATATAADQQLLMWKANTGTDSAIKSKGAAATRDALIAAATGLKATATEQLAATASTQISTIEQLVLLPYVVGRDIAALGTAKEALEELGSGSAATDAKALTRVAVTLVPAKYHVDQFVPTLAQALTATPGTPPPNAANALSYLSSYADFMGYAADSNLTYLKSLTKDNSSSRSTFNLHFAEFDREGFQGRPADPGNQAATISRLAWALHYFLTSSVLVAEVGAIDPSQRSDSRQLNSVVITDQTRFANQVAGAEQTASSQERLLAGANLNSSMLRFISGWGQSLATDRQISVSDARRRLGLEFQWNSVTLAFLLLSTNINGG